MSICPNVTQTIFTGPGVGPSTPCGPGVFSVGSVFVRPDNTCTTSTNTDLGAFVTTQNPFGAFVGVHAPNNCTTSPPTLGAGVGQGAAVTLKAARRGFCATTLTVDAQTGPFGAVLFPIGSLSLGTYDVTVTFPDQTVFDPRTPQGVSWIGSRVSGTLRVGATFTETVRTALATPGKRDTLAELISNSVAGDGAGRLLSSKTSNPSVRRLEATEYYACGTISISARATFGKRAADGVARLVGNGSITGGTGNYVGLEGRFTLVGRANTKTGRSIFALKGIAAYRGRPGTADSTR